MAEDIETTLMEQAQLEQAQLEQAQLELGSDSEQSN